MKIAVYSGNIPSTTFVENLINGLSDAGHKIILFGKIAGKVTERNNVNIIPTPSNEIPLLFFVLKEFLKLFTRDPKLFVKSLKSFTGRSQNIKSFFRRAGVLLPVINNKPDIFHIQWAKTVQQYPELFTLIDSRIALSLRGAHINYSPIADKPLAEAYKKYFPSINGFHAVSKAIGEEAVKYGADENKIKVIYTSVRKELLQKNSGLYHSGILEIISVGRFHWKKGYHYALDAMKKLKDQGVKFNYTIIAQGDIPEEIIFLMNEYKLSECVKIIQGMEYEKLIQKLQSSHILLLPSVEEGIANVVLEAMATGVPVITTDCGGMNEAVQDGVNGYVVSSREPEDIVKKINNFVNSDNEFKKNLTAKASQTVCERFSGERQVKEFSEFYNSIFQ
ncbi:MAG: glycosyltransferase family 4 protein [Bacteroidota bacterium]|nr:glycosyltransferase family 4 protein [Bacteroidota bacterium]